MNLIHIFESQFRINCSSPSSEENPLLIAEMIKKKVNYQSILNRSMALTELHGISVGFCFLRGLIRFTTTTRDVETFSCVFGNRLYKNNSHNDSLARRFFKYLKWWTYRTVHRIIDKFAWNGTYLYYEERIYFRIRWNLCGKLIR